MSETKVLTEKLSEYLQHQRIWYSYEIIPKVIALEEKLAKAQELIKEVDCGITLDDGLPSDPDFCCGCENDYDGGECFWLKLKKALGGSSPSTQKGEVLK